MRATTSEGPLAGKGTIIVIGRDGYDCGAALDMFVNIANSTTVTVNFAM
jgi:hypothetical protein